MSTRAVAHELSVHFSTIILLQSCFREFGSTSNRPHNRRPRVTTPAQHLHIQHLHLQDRLRPATQTAAATIGLHNQRISVQKLSETVSGKLICMLVILIGVSTWLQFVVVTDLNGKWSHLMASGTLERCSLHGWIPVFTVYGRWQTCMVLCGWVACWCQCCGSSGRWWRWGYGMGRHMLWTTNTGAFYWWHFECTEIPWRDPEAHCFAIYPRPSPHVAAW